MFLGSVGIVLGLRFVALVGSLQPQGLASRGVSSYSAVLLGPRFMAIKLQNASQSPVGIQPAPVTLSLLSLLLLLLVLGFVGDATRLLIMTPPGAGSGCGFGACDVTAATATALQQLLVTIIVVIMIIIYCNYYLM